MSNFDLDMQRALEADGEKLRQLTGEDHGPWKDLPRHSIDWQFQRGDDTLEVIIHYDIEPYVPAKISGPPEDCYPAEGGCVDVLVATKPGVQELVELTKEEEAEVTEWIERNQDHNEDRYGDSDGVTEAAMRHLQQGYVCRAAAYDQWRDDEMMGLHDPSRGWDD